MDRTSPGWAAGDDGGVRVGSVTAPSRYAPAHPHHRYPGAHRWKLIRGPGRLSASPRQAGLSLPRSIPLESDPTIHRPHRAARAAGPAARADPEPAVVMALRQPTAAGRDRP